MPLTDSTLEVAKHVQGLLETNKASLGLLDVFYGDQAILPRTPAATVDAGEKTRDLNGAPRRTEVRIRTYVMLYIDRVQAVSTNDEQAADVAEQIETLIHTDRTFGGRVIHSMVTALEPGYATRGGTPMRATRITIESTSQVMLPYGGA